MNNQTQGNEFKYKGVDYVFRPETLSQLKAQLCHEFEARFFSRANRRFFGDIKHYWSKSSQTLQITRNRAGVISKVYYKPVLGDDQKLRLQLV